MEIDIKDMVEKYKEDKCIRRHADKYFPNDRFIFNAIYSKEDVEIKMGCVQKTIDIYEPFEVIELDDIEQMEEALGEYEIAIQKVLQCYNMKELDLRYTSEELIELIKKIHEYEQEIQKFDRRRVCRL